jgi:hypothetical protein
MSAYHLAFQDTIIECEDAENGAIRWAVGSIGGPRGATWRLWGNKKGDVYVAARSITREAKASFHRDCKCHLGFTHDYYNETARTRFPGLTSRHWDHWVNSDEPVVRALQIVLPASELRSFASQEAAQTKWLPPPSENSTSEISIFIVDRRIAGHPTDSKWPGSSAGAQPLGFIDIPPAGRTIWVVHVHNALDAGAMACIEQQRRMVEHLADDYKAHRAPDARAMLAGSRQGLTRFCLEFAWS